MNSGNLWLIKLTSYNLQETCWSNALDKIKALTHWAILHCIARQLLIVYGCSRRPLPSCWVYDTSLFFLGFAYITLHISLFLTFLTFSVSYFTNCIKLKFHSMWWHSWCMLVMVEISKTFTRQEPLGEFASVIKVMSQTLRHCSNKVSDEMHIVLSLGTLLVQGLNLSQTLK